MRNRLAGLDQAQKSKAAIEYANVTVGGDHGDGMAIQHDAADQIAFRTQRREWQFQTRDQRRRGRRADHHRTVTDITDTNRPVQKTA